MIWVLGLPFSGRIYISSLFAGNLLGRSCTVAFIGKTSTMPTRMPAQRGIICVNVE